MKKNIFLVDDDELEIEAMKRALNSGNLNNKFKLNFFMDGEAVINRLEGIDNSIEETDKNNIPHIMILDLNMPKVDGFEVLDRIRNNHKLKSMVIFILSTSRNTKEIKRAYSKNVAGYLVKEEMGKQYEKLSELLETYSNTVALPPN